MTTSRRIAPLPLLLIGLAAIIALLPTTSFVQAQDQRTPPSDLLARLARGGVELSWDAPLARP